MTLDLFVSIGITEQKACETLRNPTLAKLLEEIIIEAKKYCDNGIHKNQGMLLYHVATRIKQQCRNHIPLLVRHISNGNIKNEQQLSAALDFVLTHSVSEITEEEFLKACGVGEVVSPDQIGETVKEIIEKFRLVLLEERYSFNMGRLMAEVRQLLRWADGGQVKREVDLQIMQLLGPKTEEEILGKKGGAGVGGAKPKTKNLVPAVIADGKNKAKVVSTAKEAKKVPAKPAPEDSEDSAATIEELMKKKTNFHKVGENYKTDGYVVTPNTMELMQKHLKETGGQVVTRFPPEPNGILHIGHAKAINIDFGYAKDMKKGKFEEGEATLRMKLTLEEGKQDPVAYRIKYVPHHRTGNKWCIYPTYDYTHCLCDSIENITHSLCTKEFQSRRSSYYWLCNALDIYCPVQWEYGRLNMNYSVVSKRKILKLIKEKIVRDWDDPRLFTLPALRRRGFPVEAINSFVAKMGLTTALGSVDPQMLEACVRDELNYTAPRAMAVLEPLKVRIENWTEAEWPRSLSVPNFPAEPEKGDHWVDFDSQIFIDQSDFRETAEKSFKRLTLAQSVGLKYLSCVLRVKDIKKDKNGRIIELVAICEKLSDQNKPKGFIHWVARPVNCEVRLYERLFKHKNPEDSNEVPGGFLTDCNEVLKKYRF